MSEKSKAGRRPYPPEVRERAVRMVFDHQDEYTSQWKAIESISAKLSINHETLRIWVRRAETDAGTRAGLPTDERTELRNLQREVKELRRANEMADSTGRRKGSCEMSERQSQGDDNARTAWAPEHRAERAGVPASSKGRAPRRHRQGDRLHGADGRSYGACRQASRC